MKEGQTDSGSAIQMNSGKRAGVIAAMIFFTTKLNLEAQTPVLPSPQENVAAAPIPDSRAEWTVEVLTSGGLNGLGRGGFSVTSAGEFACSGTTPCTRQIPKPTLKSLEDFINLVNLPPTLRIPDPNLPIRIPASPSVCSDCVVTTMYLRIRDSKGILWIYTASWDVTTQSSIPLDFRRIFQSAVELAN
jgi:hypothetical protein